LYDYGRNEEQSFAGYYAKQMILTI